METYRLNSKLQDQGNEFVIQTMNDAASGVVSSSVYVNGLLAESNYFPHPVEVNPDEVMSLVKLKHVEKKQEIEHLLQAARKVLGARDVESMCQLGMAFFYKALHDQARTLFFNAVTIDPECHQAYHYLGLCEQATGRMAEAIDAGQLAVRKRPGYADYHNALGEAYLGAGRVELAISAFEEAIRINLYYSDAYFNLGLALLAAQLGSQATPLQESALARAVDCFKKATLIYPEYHSLPFDQGMEALRTSSIRNAFTRFAAVREEKRERRRQEFAPFHMRFILSPEWISDEAVVHRIQYLQQELERNPTYVDLHAELSRCYLELAKLYWGKGVQQLKRTVDLHPSLGKIRDAHDTAEREYESLSGVLSRIVEKA